MHVRSPRQAPHPRSARARFTFPLLLASLAILLGGCAATPAGIPGADAFHQSTVPVVLKGPRDAMQAAQCFEEQGRFLPLSEFSSDSAAGRFTYRLRVSDLWFEQVRITGDGSGSQAEWRLAPNLNARWQTGFESDRLQPLRRCLGL